MNRDDRERVVWRYILTTQLSTEEAIKELAGIWQEQVEAAEEEGYDMAAQDITTALQKLIPAHADTVPKAQIQGAWRDAAKIALLHLGRYRHRK